MDCPSSVHQPGVEEFFLIEGPGEHRIERDKEIEKEVRAYLEGIALVAPYLEHIDMIPKKELAKIKVPKKPEVLIWLEKVEKWGFMWPGTYLDQQIEFMEDIETVDRVRQTFRNERMQASSTQFSLQNAFDKAPAPTRLA